MFMLTAADQYGIGGDEMGIWQEILCDAFGGMNDFADAGKISSGLNVAEFQAAVREIRDELLQEPRKADIHPEKRAARRSEAVNRDTERGPPANRFSIVTVGNKSYVQADRQVLSGNDPAQWQKQIEGYINESIRGGDDVVFPTSDGHILILTARSAYKLSDPHVSKVNAQVRELLSK